MDSITYQPIGVLRTPFAQSKGAPIQPSGARGAVGRAELDPELTPALEGLEGFSHVILLYHCHLTGPVKLKVKPFLDKGEHGLFSVRAPARPNPIGLSVVRVTGVEGSVVHLADVDMLDGTPLLDIKPFVPAFDQPQGEVRAGWLEEKSSGVKKYKGDDRFGRQDGADGSGG